MGGRGGGGVVVCSSRRRSIRSSSSSSSSCTRAPLSQRRVAHLAAPPPHVAVGHHVVQLPRGLRQNLGHQRRRVGRHHRAVHRHQPRRVVQVLAQVGKRLLATRVDNHRRPALQQAPREPAPDRPHASNDPASLADERHGVVNLVWGCALRWGCRSAARDASEHRRGWSLAARWERPLCLRRQVAATHVGLRILAFQDRGAVALAQ